MRQAIYCICAILVLINFFIPIQTVSLSRSQITRPPVHFNEDGTFKIVTFTDLHYGEGRGADWGPENDWKSWKVMSSILSWEDPDFVVYTGDLMSAEVIYANGSAYMDKLLDPVIRGNYRWASTYGNHDIGDNVTREEILQAEQKYNLSYTQQGEDGLWGNTNYFIPIYAANVTVDDNTAPTLILWFFDSRGGRNSSGGISAYVHETVVDWFNREVTRIKGTWGPIPSLAFFHYPTAEYKPIHEEIIGDMRPECPGIHEDISTPQEKDTGFMGALVNSGMIKASFVGHNHGNAWCCYYRNMNLCYNRQSGHGGGWPGLIRGSRIIILDIKDLWAPETSSYIRLENGNIVDHFPKQ